MSELAAHASQGNTLLAHTKLHKATHVITAGLNADERGLEVEHQVIDDVVLTGFLAVVITVLLVEADVGAACCHLGVQPPIVLAQPVIKYAIIIGNLEKFQFFEIPYIIGGVLCQMLPLQILQNKFFLFLMNRPLF